MYYAQGYCAQGAQLNAAGSLLCSYCLLDCRVGDLLSVVVRAVQAGKGGAVGLDEVEPGKPVLLIEMAEQRDAVLEERLAIAREK